MSISIVWIDREHAKLFHLSGEKMERKAFKAGHVEHHHPIDQMDQERFERKLFQDVGAELEDATTVLIIGPGMAKHHFLNYLREHLPRVGKKVAGCETVDHPTDAQIAAYASKYFK